MSMEKWQKRSRTVHKLNVAERAAFCKQNNMTELDLLRIEYGEDWWKQPLPLAPITWQFALGKDLLPPETNPDATHKNATVAFLVQDAKK